VGRRSAERATGLFLGADQVGQGGPCGWTKEYLGRPWPRSGAGGVSLGLKVRGEGDGSLITNELRVAATLEVSREARLLISFIFFKYQVYYYSSAFIISENTSYKYKS